VAGVTGTGTEPQPPGLTPVYLSNGTRTSGGTGPGVVHVPPDEAAWLVAQKLAIHGQQPPLGLLGGGAAW
jgi:hypothetical protein